MIANDLYTVDVVSHCFESEAVRASWGLPYAQAQDAHHAEIARQLASIAHLRQRRIGMVID